MPEWLANSVSLQSTFTPQQMLVRLLVATLCGACVAFIYRMSHGRAKEDSATLLATLVLLSILIAMVSLVIGDNVARAFSLVGALSIVRFRTVVEDTRDTAFVIFAVIVGMASGAGMLLVPLVGIPTVGAVAIWLSRSPIASPTLQAAESNLSVRLGLGHDPSLVLGSTFGRHLREYRLVSAGTARQGSALDVSYSVRLAPEADAPRLVSELNQLEGVQSVELRV